jgi:hypothetical protein
MAALRAGLSWYLLVRTWVVSTRAPRSAPGARSQSVLAEMPRIFYKWTNTKTHIAPVTGEGHALIKPNNKSETRPRQGPPATSPDEEHEAQGRWDAGNVMVLLTIASVLVSTLVGVPWITPILHVGAVFPFYFRAMKQHRHRSSLALIARWAAAAFMTTMLLGAFVPGKVEESLLFSSASARVVESWLTSQGSPPANYPYLLWGLVAFLAGTVVSGGLAGFLMGSVAIGAAASGALFVFAHGNNVFQMMIVAIPPWQWSAFGCAAFLMVPAARPFFDRFVQTERVAEEKRVMVVFMYAGASCFLLSIILRWATAGALHDLVRRWTILP